MAIVRHLKRIGDFSIGDFLAPLSRFTKYPIFLSSLLILTRIKKIWS